MVFNYPFVIFFIFYYIYGVIRKLKAADDFSTGNQSSTAVYLVTPLAHTLNW